MIELEQRYGAEFKDIDDSGITDIMDLGLLVGNTCNPGLRSVERCGVQKLKV